MKDVLYDSEREELRQAFGSLDESRLQQIYWEQGEFLTVGDFLPQPLLDRFLGEVEQVRVRLNRNYIPGHKKGGSVSYYILRQAAPTILALYQSSLFLEQLSRLAGLPLLPCPEDDPHACALYFYTEPGDRIGYHYDTSYYKGARYTVLIGLVDRSSSRLVCRLHTKEPGQTPKELALATPPGLLVFFNGDKLYHAVTPLQEGEERIILTMQYVSNQDMGPFHRWFSNMKDAVGYFGWPALFRRSSRSG